VSQDDHGVLCLDGRKSMHQAESETSIGASTWTARKSRAGWFVWKPCWCYRDEVDGGALSLPSLGGGKSRQRALKSEHQSAHQLGHFARVALAGLYDVLPSAPSNGRFSLHMDHLAAELLRHSRVKAACPAGCSKIMPRQHVPSRTCPLLSAFVPVC
jgi:hypothetical protein